MSNKWRDFKFFDHDEPNPIGKYKQPEENPRIEDGHQGYPAEHMDYTGTMTYGRWVDGYGKKKEREEIRGCKNTHRGKKFYNDYDARHTTPPAPDKGRRR